MRHSPSYSYVTISFGGGQHNFISLPWLGMVWIPPIYQRTHWIQSLSQGRFSLSCLSADNKICSGSSVIYIIYKLYCGYLFRVKSVSTLVPAAMVKINRGCTGHLHHRVPCIWQLESQGAFFLVWTEKKNRLSMSSLFMQIHSWLCGALWQAKILEIGRDCTASSNHLHWYIYIYTHTLWPYGFKLFLRKYLESDLGGQVLSQKASGSIWCSNTIDVHNLYLILSKNIEK